MGFGKLGIPKSAEPMSQFESKGCKLLWNQKEKTAYLKGHLSGRRILSFQGNISLLFCLGLQLME